MPDTPRAITTPTPVPTTVRRVGTAKKTTRKTPSVPASGDSRLGSLETASRQHEGQLDDLQQALKGTQDLLQGALGQLGELQKQTTQLRFSVPVAKMPLNAKLVKEAISANGAQWFEVLRDFSHGSLKLTSTTQLCSQQYRDLPSYVRVGLQLSPIDDPHSAA